MEHAYRHSVCYIKVRTAHFHPCSKSEGNIKTAHGPEFHRVSTYQQALAKRMESGVELGLGRCEKPLFHQTGCVSVKVNVWNMVKWWVV